MYNIYYILKIILLQLSLLLHSLQKNCEIVNVKCQMSKVSKLHLFSLYIIH